MKTKKSIKLKFMHTELCYSPPLCVVFLKLEIVVVVVNETETIKTVFQN